MKRASAHLKGIRCRGIAPDIQRKRQNPSPWFGEPSATQKGSSTRFVCVLLVCATSTLLRAHRLKGGQ